MSLAHRFWPRWYRLLARFEPAIAWVWRRVGIGNVVLVELPGRRSGQPRPVFLGLLRVGGSWYLGHPDEPTAWTRNLEAAEGGELEWHDGRRTAFRARLLPPGAEREAAIRATFRQHPFPGNVLYWLLRDHVRRAGTFFRIDPVG